MEQAQVLVSVYQKSKNGNALCGDSYFYAETEGGFICALADGLGSGERAMESSQTVIDIIKANKGASIEVLVKKCNDALMGMRGVVLGILKIDFPAQTYSFSSIGNIGMMTITKDKKKKRNIPSAGYLAGYKRNLKVVSDKLQKGMKFILFSDGVEDRELSHCFFTEDDVDYITRSFADMTEQKRKDDTTLIAMHYRGK